MLVVTPEIAGSSVIKDLELPRLLELEADPAFTLSIASTIERDPGRLDYGAPDRLLCRSDEVLSNLRQDAVLTHKDIANVARDHCRRRMEALRQHIGSAGRVIEINIQTRTSPSANRLPGDLVVRLRPPLPGDRRPNRRGLQDMQLFLGDLPHLIETAYAAHARVFGGAHLSVAFALGAALPTTLLGRVEAVDTAGQLWSLTDNAPAPGVSDRLIDATNLSPNGPGSGDTFVYIDLLPTRSDAAFERMLGACRDRIATALHIRTKAEGNLLATEGGTIVAEVSQAIRSAISRSEMPAVHLFLRCPWTVALLLGRTLNTVRVNLYEWEDGPDGDGNLVAPRYLPSIVVRSGAGGSPIESVNSPTRLDASD